jgi:hypothetical protein
MALNVQRDYREPGLAYSALTPLPGRRDVTAVEDFGEVTLGAIASRGHTLSFGDRAETIAYNNKLPWANRVVFAGYHGVGAIVARQSVLTIAVESLDDPSVSESVDHAWNLTRGTVNELINRGESEYIRYMYSARPNAHVRQPEHVEQTLAKLIEHANYRIAPRYPTAAAPIIVQAVYRSSTSKDETVTGDLYTTFAWAGDPDHVIEIVMHNGDHMLFPMAVPHIDEETGDLTSFLGHGDIMIGRKTINISELFRCGARVIKGHTTTGRVPTLIQNSDTRPAIKRSMYHGVNVDATANLLQTLGRLDRSPNHDAAFVIGTYSDQNAYLEGSLTPKGEDELFRLLGRRRSK